MTAQGSPRTRFDRAIERRSVFLAETAARELGRLELEDALELVLLYAAAKDQKYGRAAARLVGRLALERNDASLEEFGSRPR